MTKRKKINFEKILFVLIITILVFTTLYTIIINYLPDNNIVNESSTSKYTKVTIIEFEPVPEEEEFKYVIYSIENIIEEKLFCEMDLHNSLESIKFNKTLNLGQKINDKIKIKMPDGKSNVYLDAHCFIKNASIIS